MTAERTQNHHHVRYNTSMTSIWYDCFSVRAETCLWHHSPRTAHQTFFVVCRCDARTHTYLPWYCCWPYKYVHSGKMWTTHVTMLLISRRPFLSLFWLSARPMQLLICPRLSGSARPFARAAISSITTSKPCGLSMSTTAVPAGVSAGICQGFPGAVG